MKREIMKSITAGKFLATGCLIIVFAGCQTGKPRFLGNLAWWQKNDTLASEYIEPPSHQFTPSESTVASDDTELPPLPPDIEKTVDSFEQDVARSYRELARQSGQSSDKIANDIRDIRLDGRNVNSVPASKPPASELSSPLTPRTGERFAANNSPERSESSSSRLQKTGRDTAKSNSNDFAPMSQSNTGGMTQYEKLAQQTLQPSGTRPTASTFSPSSSPLKPAASNDFAAQANRQPAAPSPPMTSNTAKITQSSQPDGMQVGYQYPSTPYQAFEAKAREPAQQTRQITEPDRQSFEQPQSGAGSTLSSKSATGLTLQIQGQGSYAPGSVRTPSPIDPNNLVLPMNDAGSSAFQPR